MWRPITWLGLAGMILSGCCHLPASLRAARPPSLPPSVAADFAIPSARQFICQEKEVQTNSHYSVKSVALTIASPPRPDRSLVLDYFIPRKDEKHPVLLILPMLGGHYPLEKYFASYFAKRGFASIIVHRETLPKESVLEALDAMLKQSVLDNRQAIDWIETRPELDARRIGLFGISMGALKGALLAPVEPRIRAATLGLVGGDLPYVLTYTTEHGISKRREAILREQHLTLPELQDTLRQKLHCEPNAVAPFVDPHRVLLILGACDTVVPIKKGLELRKKMGKPETVLVPTGHYSAILFLPYIQRKCFNFFRRKLTLPETR